MRSRIIIAALAAAAALGGPAAGAAAAAAAPTRCAAAAYQGRSWGVVTGAHVAVHFRKGRAGARADARRIRNAAETSWRRFAALLERMPPSDARLRACRNGGDGRLDLYLVPRHRLLADGTMALYLPYDGEPCSPRAPGLILMRPRVRRAIVAHEVFHAFQAAYRRAGGCGFHTEWDEAAASWAMDHVFPRDDDEHAHLANRRMDVPVEWAYGGWMFIYRLVRDHGPGFVSDLNVAQERFLPLAAIDRALAGRAQDAFAAYAASAWNTTPLPGTSVGPSFRQWDRIAQVGAPLELIRLEAPGGEVRRWPLLERVRVRSTVVRRITVPAATRWVRVRPLAAQATASARVGAFLRVAGTWRYEDWSSGGDHTFCRERAAEDIEELVLLTSNAHWDDSTNVVLREDGEIAAAATCGPPERIEGTFSGSVAGDVALTWQGSIVYAYAAEDRPGLPFPPGAAHYRGVAGSAQWQAVGTLGDCTVRGSGTIPAAAFATKEGANGTITLAPGPGATRHRYGLIAQVSTFDALPATITCPGEAPRTYDVGYLAGAGGLGALLSTTYALGQPPENLVTDMRTFRGAISTDEGQTWRWDLVGTGAVPPEA